MYGKEKAGLSQHAKTQQQHARLSFDQRQLTCQSFYFGNLYCLTCSIAAVQDNMVEINVLLLSKSNLLLVEMKEKNLLKIPPLPKVLRMIKKIYYWSK